MLDALGWIATVLTVGSYFTRQPATLRRVQSVAACLWAVYGALIHALPIIAANVIVAGVAIATAIRFRPAEGDRAP